ncbi:sugar ABC transporter ATP-binding protein [Luteolibacter sp. GHJ8]|uniref:Sugar ABC transporter ATP-binding protein n=1 Tax=Luteolibacter rhizosphaerae TaxID=2989719 RepID=A0ABT3G163_9BACT|nr:sugar ABC transporter ATP-binding protein [Luteolibacter rhizosphaerae]MCW1913412.1 sugar ABC transporter ATP-binding protein [Luteolibacter rhizosphaerae]
MKTLLQLSDVRKSFGAVRALKGVSFDLLEGEVHALLGENGAGKSTLIKVITGAHAPDEGVLKVGEETLSALTPAHARALGIACIYQQPALFPDLSVAENIGLRLKKPKAFSIVSRGEQRRKALELLKRVGAEIPPDKEVRELSMPEQQLVEIACALGSGAKIVIMDEPTASLTQKEQHLLFGVVRDLRASGVGVVYISHRLEEIFALADRVTVLRDGESVGTHAVKDLNEAAMIKLMVGREVATLYPPAEGEPGATVLSVKELCCKESGVRDVSLEVRAGEIVGMAGLVGAGRTELARILFGITPADGGEILLEGRPVRIGSPREAIAQGIAYVPEDRRRHGVILEMPIAHNISMAVHPVLFRGSWLRGKAETDLAKKFIADLGIKAYGPEAPGGSLSGGNQQKVSVSRWLATKPKLLILDEPTQGVDVGAKSEIHRIIRELAKEGLAVLMISSDLPEVLGMSDRIAVMREGTLAAVLPGGSDADTVMAAALGQRGKEVA